ncbi:bifunctional UDP-sugar hydrolase/5'-nucleotidase [Corynebacterium sp. P5848]|uniref:bifunctional metallophosphatase/5'-nucleotidase n=1 Tax=Corynebacterium marambiense TaxID=2765364 RepID=UPI002260E995|nr:bifunctional UDP-sugar hydrolase/5'-nucleotidase [Corynebacterium marambiense]MCX7542143.1 bifunctional UDP-sugar hydrolase/5'-nucleotidase [Corynebacterium marambiense]
MTIYRHSFLSALTVGALVFSGLAAPLAGAEEVTPVTLNILATSDFHGHISAVHGRGGALVDPGAAALACYINAERGRNPDTNFVAAGDLIGGSPFVSSILRDKPILDAFNAMGLDVSALGNHEFDNGVEDVSARVSFDGTGQAKFPYIAANITGADPAPAPSHIITTASGIRIAYVGGVTAETPSIVNPDGVVGLRFDEPVAAMNAEAERIAAADEADVIVGLVHEGVHVDSGFSDAFDAVVAGHTHRETLETGPAREGRQPLVVVQPGEYGRLLSDIDIVIDPTTGEISSVTASNHTADDIWTKCGETPDPEVHAIVTAAEEAAAEEGQRVVATVPGAFLRGRDSADGETGGNRGVESSLNSLLADVALDSINAKTALKADIGVMNAGGVRADLAAGEVTFADAYQVQPFGNPIGTVDITGAQFIELLEQQWKPGQSRPRLALGLSSNVTYIYDPAGEQGSRITRVLVNGTPIDPAATYRVAGNRFLLNEGDSFTAFGTQTGSNTFTDTGLMDVDLFISYLAANPNIAPRHQQTSIGVHLDGAADDGSVTAGSEITVNLFSLSYTGGEPVAENVTVTLGDEKVTVPVDNTIVPTNDETGRASATLTVPGGSNNLILHIETDSGTVAELPLTVTGGDTGEPEPATPGSSSILSSDIQKAASPLGNFAYILGGGLAALIALFVAWLSIR